MTRLGSDALQVQLTLPAAIPVVGQEEHPGGVVARRRQLEAKAAALLPQKLVRNLKEDAGAVPRFRVAPGGPPMRQAAQDLDALLDNLM
jgi:hypothetical protein